MFRVNPSNANDVQFAEKLSNNHNYVYMEGVYMLVFGGGHDYVVCVPCLLALSMHLAPSLGRADRVLSLRQASR